MISLGVLVLAEWTHKSYSYHVPEHYNVGDDKYENISESHSFYTCVEIPTHANAKTHPDAPAISGNVDTDES